MLITETSKAPQELTPNFDISDIPITSLVPLSDHYYADNRARLLKTMKKVAENFSTNSIAIFKGHYAHSTVFDSDSTGQWMPEWNFHYLFGLKDETDCYAVIDFSNMETTIALKEKSEEDLIFEGGVSTEDDPAAFGFSKFISIGELENFVRDRAAEQVYVMKGMIRDDMSNFASFPWLDSMDTLNCKWLYAAICQQRAVKSTEEIVQMKQIARISAEAHKYVMRKVEPNMTEFKLRELFKLYCGLNGAPHEAYGSICGCGPHAAILHYIVNDTVLGDGKLVLSDMGARGNGYCADITCTYPINGKFTKEQREIYTIVLEANLAAAKFLKPGLKFTDSQTASFKGIAEGLIRIGILTCDIDTAMEHVSLKLKLISNSYLEPLQVLLPTQSGSLSWSLRARCRNLQIP